jgi:hypothetical protein
VHGQLTHKTQEQLALGFIRYIWLLLFFTGSLRMGCPSPFGETGQLFYKTLGFETDDFFKGPVFGNSQVYRSLKMP